MAGSPMTKGQRRARILAAAVVLWIGALVVLIALGYGRAEAASAVAGDIGPVVQRDLGVVAGDVTRGV